jgi:hypothetical protein
MRTIEQEKRREDEMRRDRKDVYFRKKEDRNRTFKA